MGALNGYYMRLARQKAANAAVSPEPVSISDPVPEPAPEPVPEPAPEQTSSKKKKKKQSSD